VNESWGQVIRAQPFMDSVIYITPEQSNLFGNT